ncbi:hypothetical protein [Agromyces mangrovi Wang et al. 2018]|uniref:hypothetical protein n=1 Tax=Agromyces mangrovi TaxID=1858653 RepID=UPI0025722736|nr:hypothetical protein [Agromyces mangrovi]BDZ65376.1 hypothetical protein GCM10025877_23140 [Agromyces mangrovi]
MTDERAPLPDDSGATTPGTTRRGALRAVAWSVPVIAVAATAPQAAASAPPDDPNCQRYINLIACHRDQDGDLYATIWAEVVNPCESPLEVLSFSLRVGADEILTGSSSVIPPYGSEYYDVYDHLVFSDDVVIEAIAETSYGTLSQSTTPDAVC